MSMNIREEIVLAPREASDTGSTAKDDRRNKHYSRTAHMGCTILYATYEGHELLSRGRYTGSVHVDSAASFIRAEFEAQRDERRPVIDLDLDWSTHDRNKPEGDEWKARLRITTRRKFRADKPSQIPSEEECIEAMGGLDDFIDWAHRVAEAGLAAFEAAYAKAEQARIASMMVSEYRSRIVEAAKVETRYEQRLAALTAEFQAEIEVQTAKLLSELNGEAGVTWEDAPGYVPPAEVTAAAQRKLPEAMARVKAPHQRSPLFDRNAGQDVSVEDL